MPELIRILVNAAMQAERQKYLVETPPLSALSIAACAMQSFMLPVGFTHSYLAIRRAELGCATFFRPNQRCVS